uniref:Uncharacterized protein n=1 Tax=Anguilla anguilla TaxID=7936 RepID=A0A0E9SFW7_ANGAN
MWGKDEKGSDMAESGEVTDQMKTSILGDLQSARGSCSSSRGR